MDRDVLAYNSLQSLIETDSDDFLDELTLGKLHQNLTENIYIDDNSEKSKEQLIHRLEYLKYGFGVRTKNVLEDVYPETKKSLGDAMWNQLGREYSSSFSTSYMNLNEIGYGFVEFLKDNCNQEWIVDLANLELQILYSKIAPIQTGMSMEEFSSLTETDTLWIRSDVKFASGNLENNQKSWIRSDRVNYFLILRNKYNSNKCSIETIDIPENIYEILTRVNGNNMNDLLMIYSQDELIQAFSILGQNQLLVSSDGEFKPDKQTKIHSNSSDYSLLNGTKN